MFFLVFFARFEWYYMYFVNQIYMYVIRCVDVHVVKKRLVECKETSLLLFAFRHLRRDAILARVSLCF